jgi:hypothetical protein
VRRGCGQSGWKRIESARAGLNRAAPIALVRMEKVRSNHYGTSVLVNLS